MPKTALTTHKLKAVRVSLANRPGALSQVTQLLAAAQVNLEGVEVEVLGVNAFARFYSRDYERAERILRDAGYIVSTNDMLEVILSDEPGELARVCRILAEGKVNMESCFGSTLGTGAKKCRFFLRVDNLDRAYKLLSGAAIPTSRFA